MVGRVDRILVAVGLIELLVGLRPLRELWNRRAALDASVGTAMLTLGIVVTDSWRWVAAGAWPVADRVTMVTAWPEPQQD